MKFRGKEVRVVLSKEATKQYDELKTVVSKEQKEGISNSFNQQLLKSINNKIDYLKMNPLAGDHAQKPLPSNLVKKYDINNLWIIDLVIAIQRNKQYITSLFAICEPNKSYPVYLFGSL